MTEEDTDVVIIGAGLSGAVVARHLAESGIRVVCLEQGGRWTGEDYRGRHDDAEVAALGPWHASPNVRRAPADYPIDDSASAMKPLMFAGVGGSTILYGAHWMRFLPSDFRVRSLDGVGDDWPFPYEELAPYYDRVDRDFGVSGVAGDPAYPSRPDYPMPPLPICAWGEKVAAAHERLGWHWWPGSNAIASRPYDGRRPCVQRSTCGSGCNEGSKASVDLTHWPAAERHGARILTHSRAREITVDGSGLADGVVYLDGEGREHRIRVRTVILAANAIGTPRLLLMSSSGRSPDGLANGSGLVGRRLMMHPFTRVIGFFDEPMMSWQGHWGQSLYSMEFAETAPDRGYIRGAKWNLSPSGGPLQAAVFEGNDGPLWGERLHRRVDKWLGRSAIWGISCEDLPEPGNRVTLDDALTDGDGLPAPRLTYAVSENVKAMLAFNVARSTESLVEAGAYETIGPPFLGEFGWHPLGTCRMGDDPETSVVDRSNRSHEVANLLIVDGSSFVTGSSVNPAATIAALALRAATRLVDSRREARVP